MEKVLIYTQAFVVSVIFLGAAFFVSTGIAYSWTVQLDIQSVIAAAIGVFLFWLMYALMRRWHLDNSEVTPVLSILCIAALIIAPFV